MRCLALDGDALGARDRAIRPLKCRLNVANDTGDEKTRRRGGDLGGHCGGGARNGIVDETGEYVDELDWKRWMAFYRDSVWREGGSREA